jgi:hypothetical protein
MDAKITHKTARYFGSQKNVHEIKWDPSEIDGREIKRWCINNFGKPGYQEEIECARWLEELDKHSITLLKDEDLTLFLLRWS